MKFGIFITGLFINLVMGNLAHAAQDYVLGAGDKVEIKVFGQHDLEVTALLGNSGEVS